MNKMSNVWYQGLQYNCLYLITIAIQKSICKAIHIAKNAELTHNHIDNSFVQGFRAVVFIGVKKPH